MSTSPGRRSVRGQQVGTLDDADERAGDVEGAWRRTRPGISAVSPPSSAQPTAAHASAMPPTTSATCVGVDAAGGDVVEEEQRAGALHEHVVDAVVDDVGADAAVATQASGQLDLGADAVGARRRAPDRPSP